MTVKVICDIGTNFDPAHKLRSILKCMKAAKGAGADAIKLQCFFPINDMKRPQEWKEKCAPWILFPSDVEAAGEDARKVARVGFWCTPFTVEGVYRMRRCGVQVLKVASSEAVREEILRAAGASGLPVAVSCGYLNTMGDDYASASWALETVRRGAREAGNPEPEVTLLHCVAEYPAPAGDLDLWKVEALGELCGGRAGWSSHVAYPECVDAAAEAVGRGARVVEVHLRVEGATPDGAPDNGPWALWPSEVREVVEAVCAG